MTGFIDFNCYMIVIKQCSKTLEKLDSNFDYFTKYGANNELTKERIISDVTEVIAKLNVVLDLVESTNIAVERKEGD
jgi:DNA integrity scanning protein DisA with diadenylate cyclase activity